jgi:cell division protein FtsN
VPEEEDQPLQEIAESVPEEDQPLQEIAEAPEQPRYIFVGANERQPEKTIYDIPLEDLIPGIVIRTPDREPVRQPAPVNERMFSVRTQLDRGWYYVQIAAFDSPEAVENALMKIDHSYLPVVYKGNDIWYRILLGPLNQGESAAVLQRFRSIGYTDAFIRQGW